MDLLRKCVGYISAEGALRKGLYPVGRKDIAELVRVCDVVIRRAFLIRAHLPFHLPEGFAEAFCRVALYGTGKHVSHGVEDDIRFLLVVVLHKLALVLGADDNGHLVLARGIDKVVQALEVNRGQLVDENGRVLPAGDIDDLEQLAHQHGQRGAIDRLAPGIVAYADNLGLLRVIDVQREIVPGKRPVQGFGGKAVERHASRCNLPLELFERLVLDGIGKCVPLHLQLVEILHHVEHLTVILPHQLNQMREGAVDAAFIDFQEPDEKVHIATGRQRKEVIALGLLPVGIFEDDFRNLGGINRVGEIPRMDGIETVRVQRVIEIHDIHLRFHRIAAVIVQQLVQHPRRKARVLEVIDKHRVPLSHHLLDKGRIDTRRFSGTRRADDHASALRRHAVDVPLMQFSIILIGHRDIDAVLVLNLLPALRKSIPIVRQVCIKTPELAPQQDGSYEVQAETGQRRKDKAPSAAQQFRSKKQHQPRQQRCQHLHPAGILGTPAPDYDGNRGKEQAHKLYGCLRRKCPGTVYLQHQRIRQG